MNTSTSAMPSPRKPADDLRTKIRRNSRQLSQTVHCASKITHGPPDPRRSPIRSQNSFSLKGGADPLLRVALGENPGL
jgi:hypothetical protein